MRIDGMKTYILENNLEHLVRELVSAGYETNEAIEIVFDGKTMTKAEFAAKYLK